MISLQEELEQLENEITKVNDIDWTDINEYTRWIDWMPHWLGKFWKRDLVVLAGYPSCWKTEFTFFLAKKNADIWNKTLYISLELKPQDLFTRIARKRAWVSKLNFQNKQNISNEQFDIIDKEYKWLQNQKNIKVLSYKKSPNVNEIINTMEKYRKMWYDLFFIDNLWKIQWDQNESIRFPIITSKLQDYKNDKNICIWLLHHLSKPTKQNQYQPWWISWIRWSQKIIDNSSLIFELYRNLDPDDPIEDKNKVDLILYKDTIDWAVWTVSLRFEKSNYFIYNNK